MLLSGGRASLGNASGLQPTATDPAEKWRRSLTIYACQLCLPTDLSEPHEARLPPPLGFEFDQDDTDPDADGWLDDEEAPFSHQTVRDGRFHTAPVLGEGQSERPTVFNASLRSMSLCACSKVPLTSTLKAAPLPPPQIHSRPPSTATGTPLGCGCGCG